MAHIEDVMFHFRQKMNVEMAKKILESMKKFEITFISNGSRIRTESMPRIENFSKNTYSK